MTPHELADAIETRLEVMHGVRGLMNRREAKLLYRDEALQVIEWLRAMETTTDHNLPFHHETMAGLDSLTIRKSASACQCGLTGAGRCPVCLTTACLGEDEA